MVLRRPIGIRSRIVFASVLTTVLVTGVVASTALFVSQRASSRELDRGLESSFAKVVEQLEKVPGGISEEDQPNIALGSDEFSVLVLLENTDGSEVVDESFGYGDAITSENVGAVANDIDGDGLFTLRYEQHWRVASQEFEAMDGAVWRLVTGRSLGGSHRQFRSNVAWAVLGSLLSSALVGVVVWLATRALMAQLDRMRREADEIEATSLYRRLPRASTDDAFGRLTATLNRMLDRLETSQVRQRQFVADTSHELRNPIAAIVAQLDVALRHSDRSDWPEIGRLVLQDARRTDRLVNDLLTVARLDEGELSAHPVWFDLDDVALHAASSIGPISSALVVSTDKVKPARAFADEDHVQQIVTNLVRNASRHALTSIQIATFTDNETNQSALIVDDDGPGIPVEERMRVFDRFVRLDAARSDAGGSGLGLAVSRMLAIRNDATLNVEESPLGGARFQLRLPNPPHASPTQTGETR